MNTSPPIAVVNIPGTFFGPHPGAKNVAATPGSLISTLLPNIMVIAAVIFFLIIIYYGFNMIVMSGRFQRGSPDDARELAKKRGILNSALFGFLLVIASYFILQILTVVTGINFMNPPVT